jgi:hypothetical protein
MLDTSYVDGLARSAAVPDKLDGTVLRRAQRWTDKKGVVLCAERVEYVHIWFAMAQQLGDFA